MLDTTKLEELFMAGKIDEAKSMLSDHLSQTVTDEERGAAMYALASVYMRMKNSINQEHLDSLNVIKDVLQRIKESEQKIDDAIGIINAQKNIDNT